MCGLTDAEKHAAMWDRIMAENPVLVANDLRCRPAPPPGKIEATCWRCGQTYLEDREFVEYLVEAGEDYTIDMDCGCETPIHPGRAMRNPAEWAYYCRHNPVEFPFGEFSSGMQWTQPAELPYVPRSVFETDPDGPFDDWDVSF